MVASSSWTFGLSIARTSSARTCLCVWAMDRWGDDVVLPMVASNANELLSAVENAARQRGPLTALIDAKQEAAGMCTCAGYARRLSLTVRELSVIVARWTMYRSVRK